MLHRYAFSNFQSFRDEAELSLRLNGKVPTTGWESVSRGGERLSLVSAVVGPNGAGKTALLKPLVFALWFIRESFQLAVDATIPVVPHFASADAPTEIEVEGEDHEGRLWRYVLRLTPQRVLHESLYQRRQGRFSYVFVRDWLADEQAYAIKQQDFGFSLAEARKVRPNASLIATAAQYGVPLAQMLSRAHVQTNIVNTGRLVFRADNDLPRAASHFSTNAEQRAAMVRLLQSWDLGLSGVELRELSQQRADGEVSRFWFPFGIHADRAGGSRTLSFLEESSGTQTAFVLLSRLLPVLTEGGVAVIDEFESDLHPHMLEPLLDLFAHPQTNPHHAQLLFTCHSSEVLNLLHKSQVMLVEKDAACESTAYRMDSVRGIRTDDNFYAKYMAGAYGAVPEFD